MNKDIKDKGKDKDKSSKVTKQSKISRTINTPCCTIMGHVDVGKTKLLDYMRHTETEEASGITQQIGTTLYNKDRLEMLIGETLLAKSKLNIDSLLMIDTPGHECFDTIRYVAAMVTDVVILIIDIIKGIEKQTIHIISLLKKHNIPFIICLNKMDRIFGWVKPNSIKSDSTKSDNIHFNLNLSHVIKRMIAAGIHDNYKDYVKKIQLQLYEYEINSELYYQNKQPHEFYNIVPISAETGEGIPDLIMLISVLAERKYLSDKLIDSNRTYGYILDTHYDKTHGKYLVALHRNGNINRGAIIDIAGSGKFKIKHILINNDNKEIKDEHKLIRVDNIDRSLGYGLILESFNNDSIHNSDIEPSSMYILSSINDNTTKLDDNTKLNNNTKSDNDINSILLQKSKLKDKYEQRWGSYLTKKGHPGIQVIAPSYIMMDGLLHLLKTDKDICCDIERYKVGKIDKKDVIISSKWYDIDEKGKDKHKNKEILEMRKYSIILYYDPSGIKSDNNNLQETDNLQKDVIEFAKNSKVMIIQSNVIYDLITSYHDYIESLNKEIELLSKSNNANGIIELIPKYIFRTTNPMIFGVIVKDGEIRPGMTIYTEQNLINKIGKIESIEKNHSSVSLAVTDDMVCLKVTTTKVIGKDINNNATLWVC